MYVTMEIKWKWRNGTKAGQVTGFRATRQDRCFGLFTTESCAADVMYTMLAIGDHEQRGTPPRRIYFVWNQKRTVLRLKRQQLGDIGMELYLADT